MIRLVSKQSQEELDSIKVADRRTVWNLRETIRDAMNVAGLSRAQRNKVLNSAPATVAKMRIPQSIKDMQACFWRVQTCHESNENLKLVYSEPLSALEIMRRRAKRGTDMAVVRGKGEYYTNERIY